MSSISDHERKRNVGLVHRLPKARANPSKSGTCRPRCPIPGGQLYGLISGLRRLTAWRNLAKLRGNGAFTHIDAFIRTPKTLPDALAAMVSENEIRADPSPWDKGRILIKVVFEGHFPTIDAAVAALHRNASRQKRARLRVCASVVEELEGLISTPDRLNENRLLRLAASLRGGLTELIQHILSENRGQSLETQ